MPALEQLWPRCAGPDDLAAIETVPLADRGLPTSTYEALVRAAALWPDRPAASFFPSADRWQHAATRTFAELAADVRRTAHALAAHGVTSGDAVALVSVNSPGLLTALLAAEAAGVAAPINPGLSPAHAAELVELAAARVIVASGPDLDPATWELGRALAERTGADALLALRPLADEDRSTAALEPIAGTTVAYLEDVAAVDADLPASAPTSDAIASYLHTGGTTGTPKLAARTHENEISNAWMIAASSVLGQDSVLFAALPLFHTNALVVTVLAPLLRGQHVVWAGPLGYRDPALYGAFWKLVERYEIAAMSAVPTVYAVLAQVPVDADISTLRLPVVGAAPMPPSLADDFRAHTGLDLCEGYGLTEGTCASTRNFPGAIRSGTVGQRLPYQEVRAVAVDEQSGAWTTLPTGQIGTLLIKGPNVFAGYLVATPDGPVPNREDDRLRDGWLNTGDLGSVDAEGFVRLAGRSKDLIIRGGHNIDPAVIEDALLAHPAVSAASAVGRPDAHAGEVPVAYVTCTGDNEVSADELAAWAAEHVPERAAAPKLVEIVDEIPLTAVGKPYKPELRRRAAHRAAADALGPEAAVTAELVDGSIHVTVGGVSDADARAALEPLSLAWRLA